jgi:membrane fusion protein (multidrug efflux system)
MKWRSWLIVALISVGLIAVLATVKYRQISSAIAFADSFPEPAAAVFAEPVEATDWQRTERTIGEVVATQTVEVKTEYPGTIAVVGFAPGARVTSDQVLLVLDTREERARMDALRARAELAGLTLKRNESLANTSAVSRQTADTAQAERDTALAEARGVQVIIDKKTLRAPFAAHAGLHEWQAGQFLAAGTTVTWLVGDSDEAWIDFSLPQEIALGVLEDQVRVSTAQPRWEADAVLIARAPYVEQRSRNVRFRALLQDADAALTPGAIVDVAIAIGDTVAALSVPATALRNDAFGPHVFVLQAAEAGADAPHRAQRREVELLEIRTGRAFLSAGVEASELVAADGAFKLRDGMLVNVSPATDSGSPASQ